MIWMRRMHVINWMYYGEQTIDWDRSNLLTGITGSGKSSLIDALQVVILGETSRFFNRSATGTKSERNLATYLRGKFHDSEYKRPDKAFSSYLTVDFFDELNQEKFCYGVVFDISEDNNIEKDFFYIPRAFQKEWALKGCGKRAAARSRGEFKKYMKELAVAVKPLSVGEYKQDLLHRLGIYDEHFFQVFRTAVAYVPLNNIEDFIVQNICHMEDTIDVPKMRTAIHEYHRMQRDMTDFQERQKELRVLMEIYQEFSNRLETYQSQEYIVCRAKTDRLWEEHKAADAEMVRLDKEREQMNQRIETLEKLLGENLQKQMELTGKIKSDPATTRRQDLQSKAEACSKRIQELEAQRDMQLLLLKQRMSAWTRRLSETARSAAGTELGKEKTLLLMHTFGTYEQHTKESFPQIDLPNLHAANLQLDQLRNQALTLQTEWKSQRNETQQKAEEYRTQLEKLKKGIKTYPKELLALRDFLQGELSRRSGKPVHVSILADLLTITEPVWVDVVEGYLRRQKFYLLTEPENHQEAVRLFKRYSQENRCYRFRLVNTPSLLSERMDMRENSLAAVIDTDHPAARKYVDYLLGHVERVEDIGSVNGRRTAVTADGMLYQGFTVARMDEADWKMRYIGQDSIAQQIEEISRLLEVEMSLVRELNGKITPLQIWAEEKTLSDEFLENLECATTGAKELPALNEQIDSIWSELQRIDDSFVKRLESERKKCEREYARLQREKDDISRETGRLENQYTALYQRSGEKEQAWQDENKRFLLIYPEDSEIVERTAMQYESKLQEKGSAEKLQLDYEPALSWTKTKLDALRNTFREKAELFNRKHTSAAISTELSSDEWRRAHEAINAVRLEEYIAQVAAAKERAEEIFYNEFINQLKRNFDTVKREINLLNRALEEYTFGKTKYRFKWSPTENTEMRKYYDMINSTRLDGGSIYDLLEPGVDLAEYEPLVKTLFQLISSEGTDQANRQQVETNIQKYKSFQTYLRFDLVEVAPDGKEYPLSRTIGSKSGGERQTPFYVAILASLMKTYRINQNANSLRLVVFDEAFDKIDTSRIEECVNMLREIGFQSIVAAPDHKASYIAPAVERTWVVIKPDDKTSILRPYRKALEEM